MQWLCPSSSEGGKEGKKKSVQWLAATGRGERVRVCCLFSMRVCWLLLLNVWYLRWKAKIESACGHGNHPFSLSNEVIVTFLSARVIVHSVIMQSFAQIKHKKSTKQATFIKHVSPKRRHRACWRRLGHLGQSGTGLQ